MSLKKYIENKIKTQIITNLQQYTEKLQADLASLLLKPNEKIVEAKKNSICITQLYKMLSEVKYPHKDQLCFALSSGDVKTIAKAQDTFQEFKNFSKNKLCEDINNEIYDYKIRLISEKFTLNDVDAVYNSCFYESNLSINKFARMIEIAISKIPSWKNCDVLIEALGSENGLELEKIKISLNNSSFLFNVENHEITEVCESEASDSIKNNILQLIKQLKENPKYNQIISLYTVQPLSERKLFDNLKKDLVLGIEATLPNHIILTNLPIAKNQDIYKIKIGEQYIKEFMCEGDQKQFLLICEEAPVRWIERINYETQH